MFHCWYLKLSDLNKSKYALVPAENLLRVYNYKIEKIRRINERAVYWLQEYIPLYDKRYGIANMSAAEMFGIELESMVFNPFDCDIKIELRDYQVAPMEELVSKPYWLLGAATWYGKSFSVARIVNRLKCKTVIVTNTQVNAEQLAERLAVQLWQQNVWLFYWPKKEFRNITVCVYNSYKKLLIEYNGKFDMFIVDESHKFISDKYRELTIRTKAQYKYGMTATPYWDTFHREDFVKRWGCIVEAKQYEEMLLGNFDFKITWVKMWWEAIEEYRDYHQLKSIVDLNPERIECIKKIVEEGLARGNKILIMTDRQEFTEKVWDALWAAWMTGSTNRKTRDEMFKKFEVCKVLVAPNQLIWEWYDNPWIDMVVVAFSWRTHPRLVQAIGRSVRIKEWKKDIYVYDIIDNAGIMQSQWRERKKVYQRYSADITMRKYPF